ncbi:MULTISPECIES: hypothetical protein [unclassified Caballeronia]|uniref:hypothetical protein n=1 Tax=unclassified Caballeronia TaxID=2646786 RepID=UPI0020293728|nr:MULTISPECIES: hypothetical protein [unclassified Caballeronia]MDR5799531.1 hypothetical protein [Caballeronia sp. LZ001]
MKAPQVTVDAQGNTIVSHSTPISEHCKSRVRLLASLVEMIAAPGAYEQFAMFSDVMQRDLLHLMHSLAEEQMPLVEALEKHTAQVYYEKGVNAALEHRSRQQQAEIAEPPPVESADYPHISMPAFEEVRH